MESPAVSVRDVPPEHPRTLGWVGTTALAMGGSNQSLFLLGALLASQGSGAVPLLAVGLLLSWAAAPGWTELILMWPRRVGGIAATCSEAFRPYTPVLANLTGVCYWWGWVPTCGLTAILSGSAIHQWYLPGVPVQVLAVSLVALFTAVNLGGLRWVTRLAIPIATASAGLALLSGLVPLIAGTVDWHRAASFHLETPFAGTFGALTSAMAGLYLIGFAAPAFEAAACHVGETRDPARNVPRAMFASAAMASVYFVVLPVVWLGVFGSHALEGDLAATLGPTFAPLLGGAAKSAAIWFLVFNMFHGTLQPLAGASRTLSQLSEDGLLPRVLARRSHTDTPWVATLLTAAMAIVFLLIGDPIWLIAAANFTYIIGIALPSVAVWLLRRSAPDMERPYRAPRGLVTAGLVAACVWGVSAVLGFQQFGLPTVIVGMVFAYAGVGLYARRVWDDRRRAGLRGFARSLHLKLTGAMVAVIALDGAGYLLAVSKVPAGDPALVTGLEDIFVAVAILTISVGLILPGMIAHAASDVAHAAARLATGTVADLTRAMEALGQGRLRDAHADAEFVPVRVRSRDEMGSMATSFNTMQEELSRAALALDGAREGLRASEDKLELNVARQAAVARLGQRALEGVSLTNLLDEAVKSIDDVMAIDEAAVFELGADGRVLELRARVGGLDAASSPATPASRGEGEPTSLTISIEDREFCFGTLQVELAGQGPFAAEEVDFLRSIANVLADAIERKRSEDLTRHQSLHDPLTGLPNRTLFADRLTNALAHAERTNGVVAVLFLDLDNFKVINDSRGHGIGDELLTAVATRLKQSLRPGDTVARFGGDEFVIVCDGLNDPSDAVTVAERTAAIIARPLALRDTEHFMTASMGIAVATGPGRSTEDLIRDADAAMYRAKERGRGRYEVFDELMRARVTQRLRVDTELRRAIERDELEVHYQPVVSMASGEIRGFEALVRWNHPERGMVSPAEFIPIAEETGVIVPIGRWVLGEACRQAAAWHASRPDDAPLAVAVNLSARQVAGRKLKDVVAETLRDSRLTPSTLHLEITESVLMEDSDGPLETLTALKRLGVSLVLDDFGTGYSSLAYVQRFPIDVLKIDRAFVAGIASGTQEATSIVAAIVKMAQGLRVDVIAEGVETVGQASALSALGCRLAQGFLYAPALPAAEVTALLERWPDLVPGGWALAPSAA